MCLWGTTSKGKLTATLLDEFDKQFDWMGLDELPALISGHRVVNFRELSTIRSDQVLLAVYPEKKERERLEAFLASLGYEMGINYWYL